MQLLKSMENIYVITLFFNNFKTVVFYALKISLHDSFSSLSSIVPITFLQCQTFIHAVSISVFSVIGFAIGQNTHTTKFYIQKIDKFVLP